MVPAGNPPRSTASSPRDNRRRATYVADVCRLLEVRYRSPTHDNKLDPLDELVFIILSQMTTAPSFGRVFNRLRARIDDWSELVDMPDEELTHLIADAGLSGQKSIRIKAIIARLVADFGHATLDPLYSLEDGPAEAYLTSLSGVGVKTAKCVLMYSLGREVLPVDTHVYRVSQRLGMLPVSVKGSLEAHTRLESVVPPSLRYSFHVNAIALGRDVCRPRRPKCMDCVLSGLCPSANV